MPIPTVEFKNNSVKIIDQTKLPTRYEFIHCKNIHTLWKAIRIMQVRGAPALGVAAAFGVYLGIKDFRGNNNQFLKKLKSVIQYLGSSRPTAVNLFWSLERIEKLVLKNKNKPIRKIKALILKEANKIFQEDKFVCRKMGEYGQVFVKNNDNILTICNAGALATADYGTALALIYKAKEKGKNIKVFACETRPLLQGARLTTWELKKHKIDTTLICDSMAASLMSQQKIDKVITGADRIASNGDSANKIGTYQVAIAARYHNIPFYVAAPYSTFDLKLSSGAGIPIEQRASVEITNGFGRQTAPDDIATYSPAFDVTPAELITGIITERGVISPVTPENVKKHFE